MFGLMRPAQNCGQNPNPARAQRVHYCGTCKVIGKQYGQSKRLLLNHDAVFLSEILTILSEEDIQSWDYSFQAINQCFVMPKNSETLPLPLQYAAAANLFFAELKLDDNIKDRAKRRYKFARFFLSSSFKKAEKQLQGWGLDTEFFWQQLQQQERLEKADLGDFSQIETLLEQLAAPTQAMTGRLFGQAASVIQKPEMADLLEKIGAEFGRLVYILDAFEDLEADIFNREFNPLARFFSVENGSIAETDLEQVRLILLQSAERLALLFGQIPTQSAQVEQLQARLFSNLHLRIYRPRLSPKTFIQKIQLRWQNAQDASERLFCSPQSKGKQLQIRLFSSLFFLLPALSVELSQQQKTQSLGAFAILTALLASLGLAKSIVPKRKKRTLWQRLKNLFSRKKQDPLGCGEFCGICEDFLTGILLVLLVLMLLVLLVAIGVAIFNSGNYQSLLIYLGVLLGLGLIGLVIWQVGEYIDRKEYRAYAKEREETEKMLAEYEAKRKQLQDERTAASELWLKENAKKPNVGLLSDQVQYEIIQQGDQNQPITSPKTQRPYGNVVIIARKLGYEPNNPNPETSSSPIHSLRDGYIKEAAAKLKHKGDKIRINIPPAGDFYQDGRVYFMEIEATEQTEPQILTSPEGLHYQILAVGNPYLPFDNHIIEYKKDCSLDKNECKETLRAPSWFKPESDEYKGLQLMKNVGARYRFFRPDSDFYQADFEIYISDKKAD